MRARKPFWLWVWLLYTLGGMVMLSACIPGIEQTEPIIVLDPVTGGPGTTIAVSGSGFPAETQVSIRLGPPSVGASPLSYGVATTDVEGRFALSFIMPAQWPDGAPITETGLVVVVLNEDASTKATSPFGYAPTLSDASTSVASPAEAHPPAILAWHREGGTSGSCWDAAVYESGYVEIRSCGETEPIQRRLLSEDAVKRLGDWTKVYQSFEVEQTKGTGANRVLTRTTFVGTGSRAVSETELQMIQALLETLVPVQ